jgi:hypothetical protein
MFSTVHLPNCGPHQKKIRAVHFGSLVWIVEMIALRSPGMGPLCCFSHGILRLTLARTDFTEIYYRPVSILKTCQFDPPFPFSTLVAGAFQWRVHSPFLRFCTGIALIEALLLSIDDSR